MYYTIYIMQPIQKNFQKSFKNKNNIMSNSSSSILISAK